MKDDFYLLLIGVGLLMLTAKHHVSGIGSIRKSKFQNPFDENGKTIKIEKKPGVYLIKEDDKIVYVGYSGYNVGQTMFRHFYQWNDRNAPNGRVTYYNKLTRHKYTVRYVYTSAAQAGKLEQALIKKHHPRDNTRIDEALEPMDVVELQKYMDALPF